MNLVAYNLDLFLIEASIWPHHWPANDVSTYCTKHVSPVYMCSLEAEGAFDAVPHAILFQKAINVIPDHCWVIKVK